jgi:hypothetical protein
LVQALESSDLEGPRPDWASKAPESMTADQEPVGTRFALVSRRMKAYRATLIETCLDILNP